MGAEVFVIPLTERLAPRLYRAVCMCLGGEPKEVF